MAKKKQIVPKQKTWLALRMYWVPKLRGFRGANIRHYQRTHKGKYPKTGWLRRDMYAYLGAYRMPRATKQRLIACATRDYLVFDTILRTLRIRK